MEDEIKGLMAEKFALREISKDVLAKRKEMDAVIKQLRADRLQLLELAAEFMDHSTESKEVQSQRSRRVSNVSVQEGGDDLYSGPNLPISPIVSADPGEMPDASVPSAAALEPVYEADDGPGSPESVYPITPP